MGDVKNIIGSSKVKNALINGDMYHWQRGTVLTSTVNGAYLCDRWKLEQSLGISFTQQISSDVPAGTNFRYSWRIQNNATASPTGIQRVAPHQPIEERVLRQLLGKRLTYSGWLKPLTFSGTVNVFVYLGANPSVRYHYKAFRVAVTANTWTRFSFDLKDNPLDNAIDLSNLPLNNVAGFVGVHLDAGPSVTGTTPSGDNWTTLGSLVEPIRYDSADYKFCSVANNQILMTGFCLGEKDEFSLSSEDHAQELLLCQRYFEKSYVTGVAVGTPTTIGAHTWSGNGASNRPYTFIYFKANKRSANPLVTGYNPRTGATSPAIWDFNTPTTDYPVAGASSSEIGFNLAPGLTPPTNSALSMQWTAEAEF